MIFVILVMLVVGVFFIFRGGDTQTDVSGGDVGGLGEDSESANVFLYLVLKM